MSYERLEHCPICDKEEFKNFLVVTDNSVSVDLNHPMAGQNLHFKGTILSVREATEDELAHGHAHGVDGHSGH